MKGTMTSILAIMMTLYMCALLLRTANARPSEVRSIEKRSARLHSAASLMINSCGPQLRKKCNSILSRCFRSVWGGRKRRSISEVEEIQELSRVKRKASRKGRRRRRTLVHANCNTCRNCR